MAQKKAVAAKGKNGLEKPAKRGAVQPQNDEEELVAPSSSKGKKLPVKEVPQSSEEDSDDEEQNGGEEDDSDSQVEDVGDLIDDEAVEDDEEDSDDSDDELEPGQASFDNLQAGGSDDDDSEDEAPVEKPAGKKPNVAKQANGEDSKPKKGGIPNVRVGKIPLDFPKNQIIFGSNLPKEFTHKDLITFFSKFGQITIVNRITNKNGENAVMVAFETAAGAEAALAAKDKALTLAGKVVAVSQLRNKDECNKLTVVVGLIGPHVSGAELKEHFERIGPVEFVSLSGNKTNPKAFVRFAKLSDAEKALKLHSTELFSRFITVRPQLFKSNVVKTPETTLILENVGKHESYSSDAIEKIFKKFDVAFSDVVCSKTILAFITFKQPESATKALEHLGGKTVNNLELKLKRFQSNSSGRSILVTNLTSDTTEEQLKEVFGRNGDLESVKILAYKAVITFTSDDAFCKSFLLNEQIINNQPVFVEPNSLLKHRILSKARTATGGSSGGNFPGKFQKFGNNKSFGGNKPFNKRPYQDNGAKSFVKRPKY